MGTTLTERLHLGLDTPGVARGFVREFCEDLALDLSCDVQLVVSELVTNAVLHGADPITLSLELTDGVVKVVVGDGGPDRPHLATGGPNGEGGRGLVLVADLVTDWGVRTNGGHGKEVWAALPRVTAADR